MNTRSKSMLTIVRRRWRARKLAPLPQVVSGSAARMRPINSAFIRQQLKANPQLQTLWSRGLTWGFSHLTFDGDKVTVRIVETPRDSSGTTQVTFEHTFTRRRATSYPERAALEPAPLP